MYQVQLGGSSYTLRIRFAHRRLSAARSGGVGTGPGEDTLESGASSLSSALRRLPRARLDYAP